LNQNLRANVYETTNPLWRIGEFLLTNQIKSDFSLTRSATTSKRKTREELLNENEHLNNFIYRSKNSLNSSFANIESGKKSLPKNSKDHFSEKRDRSKITPDLTNPKTDNEQSITSQIFKRSKSTHLLENQSVLLLKTQDSLLNHRDTILVLFAFLTSEDKDFCKIIENDPTLSLFSESLKLLRQLKSNESQILMTSIERISTSKFNHSKLYYLEFIRFLKEIFGRIYLFLQN